MRHKLIFSFLISLAVMLACYFVGNLPYPLGGEQEVLNSVDIVKSMLGLSHDSVPDNVLLVNVAYDKQLVPYEEEGMPVGNYAITDRRKLLTFLKTAKKAGNYQYIILDVIFEKGIRSDVDKLLFGLITNMPRIVIPRHDDVVLEDRRLYKKAANSDYSITSEESSFTRFQFLHGNVPSMPLKMYAETTGKTITRHGIFYSSNGRLCKDALTLKLPIRISGEYINKDTRLERSYINLGVDLTDIDSIMPISEQIKGKTIVIGDFSNDIHSTYAGLMPGSLICLNAYYALKNGDHFVNWWITLFILLVYVMATYIILSDVSVIKFVKFKLVRIGLSFVGIAAVLYLLALVLYLCFGYVYNMVASGYAFAIIITVKQIYKAIKDEDEKSDNSRPAQGTATALYRNAVVGVSANPANNGGQLQDSLHELPTADDRREGGEGRNDIHRQVGDKVGEVASGDKGHQPANQKTKSDGGKRPQRGGAKHNRHSH